jgi:transcriptional regulator GlxA family with amidase domain
MMLTSLNQIRLTLEEPPKVFERVKSYVLANYGSTITINQLARATGLSRYGFCRQFYRECRVTPIRWLWHFRVLLAARLIECCPHYSLIYICTECGFKSAAHFSRAFKSHLGMSPSQYRKMCEIERKKEEISTKLGKDLGIKQNDFLEEIMVQAFRSA